jgi:NadR type nicotinamide-nucleotide adenylyltransferase
VVRVVLTGSESTGKTTLSQQLGGHFGAIVVPEFVRDYAARKGAPLDFADHGPIARGQMALEDDGIARGASTGARLIVQDTDLLSTVVYCDHYFGRCPEWIRDEALRRRPDLYLLMDIDVPWVADDVRDRGHIREEMQDLFRRAVDASGAAFETIGGEWEKRLESGARAIERLWSP